MGFAYEQTAQELANDIARQTEKLILQQLGDLVKAGLLVMKTGPMRLCTDPAFPTSIRLFQDVSFELKDQEYINALKAENEDLRKRLNTIREMIR